MNFPSVNAFTLISAVPLSIDGYRPIRSSSRIEGESNSGWIVASPPPERFKMITWRPHSTEKWL